MKSLGGFDLDPFFLFTDGERNLCLTDIDPEAPYECVQITCRSIRDHRSVGKRLSDLAVVIPCDPAPDVIFTWGSECLIQEKVVQIFNDERLTGFTTRPARAKLEATGLSLRVSELLVIGWGGFAPEASGIREVGRCPTCGHLHYSAIEEPRELVNVNNWDGSDFFMVWPLPKFRFVTARVAEVCRKYRLTGVLLERNLPVPRISSGYSPGRLSFFMPPERAHSLGDALQIF